MSLASSIAQNSLLVNKTIERFFDEQKHRAGSIDAHLLTSLEELRAFVLRGGKTLRPLLVETAYALASGVPHDDLIKIAAATELHHKHILILDDIADRDETRYGGPTLEYAYRKLFTDTPNTEHRALSYAMLDSVWLGSLARELILESAFDPKRILSCLHILNTTMYRDTLAGWQIHALQCDQPLTSVTKEEFIKGLELVTARYTFEGPFAIGLTLAGNTDENLTRALTTYSQKVGTAFQIHDDILGLFGNSEDTGKPVGNDVREGKKTLLVQVAYERATKNEQAFLESVVGNKDLTGQDCERVRSIVKGTGSLTYSQELEKEMAADGIRALASLPQNEHTKLLIELAHYIISREK
jgi:geranylgeranyl diphosphate synthase type I